MIHSYELPRHFKTGTVRHIAIETTKLEDWRSDLKGYGASELLDLSDRGVAETAFEENAALLASGPLRTFVDDYLGRANVDGEYMLHAHGGPMRFFSAGGRKMWGYQTGFIGKERVQNWVDAMDKEGRILYVAVCNKDNSDITSKHSPLIYPDDLHSVRDGDFTARPKLYVPGRGLISG